MFNRGQRFGDRLEGGFDIVAKIVRFFFRAMIVLRGVLKRLSPDYGKDISCRIGRFKINLPYGHMLPFYREKYLQYDKFLPHLAKFLPKDCFVIDVGANCADTVAGMIDANPCLNFLCIEADEFFFQYLISNVEVIREALPCAQVKVVNALVGFEVSNVTMMGDRSTKKAVPLQGASGRAIKSRTLDDIINNERIQHVGISLLKVDTDGYDYDVINSASLLLRGYLPLLFFECQYDGAHQKEKYRALIRDLAGKGYVSWSVFDNFGALLLRAGSQSNVLDLIDYVWCQNVGKSHRTFYYLDIFAGTFEHGELIGCALLGY